MMSVRKLRGALLLLPLTIFLGACASSGTSSGRSDALGGTSPAEERAVRVSLIGVGDARAVVRPVLVGLAVRAGRVRFGVGSEEHT